MSSLFQTLQSPKVNSILIPKPPLILPTLEGGAGRIGGAADSACLVPLNQPLGVGGRVSFTLGIWDTWRFFFPARVFIINVANSRQIRLASLCISLLARCQLPLVTGSYS